VDDLQAAATALGVQGTERSRVMSSSQTTREARPDDRQIGYFPYLNGGFARSSAILRSGGVHRNGSGLSPTPNAGTLAPELRADPEKQGLQAQNKHFKKGRRVDA